MELSVLRIAVTALAFAAAQSLYAQGTCESQWLPGTAASALNGTVEALVRLPNGDLVAAGYFDQAGGTTANGIARWNGAAWSPLGTGTRTGTYRAWAKALVVMPNGDVVAGGNFTTAGDVPVNYIARWNGTAWSAIGSGMNAMVEALLIMPNGDLIAGGRFTAAGGVPVNRVARWNGVVWSAVGGGMSDGSVTSFIVRPNGDLVAGGTFTTAEGNPASRVARWTGLSWGPLGAGMSGPGITQVHTFVNMPNGDLVAGGFFTQAGVSSAVCVARWDGSAWSPMGPGINGAVRALLYLQDGQLIAAGDFTSSGYFTTDFVARWTGSIWLGVGSGVSERVFAATTLANGDLVVGGDLLAAGGLANLYWARWTLNNIPTVAVHPRPASMTSGETMVLSAAAMPGYGEVSYRWQRDGVDITDGPGGASPGGGTVAGAAGILPTPTDGIAVEMTITGIQPSDAGAYRFVLTNACGPGISDAAQIEVSGGHPCNPDYNQDGGGDNSDIFDLANDIASGTQSYPPSSPDFNQDGGADNSDVIDLANVVAGGPCP